MHIPAKREMYTIIVPIIFCIFNCFSYSNILYVPDDFNTIQLAISSTDSGDTICIDEGVYYENLTIEVNPITISSKYIFTNDSVDIANTIISGGNQGRVLYVDDVEGLVRIIGLVFTGGYAVDEGEYGGGINSLSNQIMISHCRFTNNSAYYGGAASLNAEEVHVVCSLFESNNSIMNSGAITLLGNGNARIEANIFRNNHSGWVGGAIGLGDMSGRLNRNVFEGNESFKVGGGCGMMMYGGSWEILENVFIGNESGRGGGLAVGNMDTVIITQNYFADNEVIHAPNRSGTGGGVSIEEPVNYALFTSNRVSCNRAELDAGGIVLIGDISFSENIIDKNIALYSGALITWAYNGENVVSNGDHNLIKSNGPLVDYEEQYQGAIKAKMQSTLTLTHSDIYQNIIFAAGISPPVWDHGTLNIENNYWGHPSGPFHSIQNPDGQGDAVHDSLDVIPFSQIPFTNFMPPEEQGLLLPFDGTTNDSIPIRFSWQPAMDENEADTVKYLLQLSPTENLDEFDTYWFIEDTEKEIQYIDFEQTWYWRVIAYDNVWLMDTSEVRSVYITSEDLVPQPFDLMQPLDEEGIDQMPVDFTWSHSPDYTLDDTVNYELHLSTSPDFAECLVYAAGEDTTLQLDSLPLPDEASWWWRVRAFDTDGHERFSNQEFQFYWLDVAEGEEQTLPKEFSLAEPFPNPFNAAVHVQIGVPHQEAVRVEVFDVLGRRVAVLVDEELPPGFHRLVWRPERAAAGLYLVRLRTATGTTAVRKVLYLK